MSAGKVVIEGTQECSGVYELDDAEVTKVERMLDVVRIRAFTRCEPGLLQLVRDKGLSADKCERKLRAYGEVLAMLREGSLRDDDLHAIRHDWSDALSSVGGWERG